MAEMKIEFPGFFDLQINGFGGVDFNCPLTTPEDIYRAIDQLRARGVTRFLPTLGTSSFERFAKCAKTLNQTPHAAMVGVHMEGPYISREDGARGRTRSSVSWPRREKIFCGVRKQPPGGSNW